MADFVPMTRAAYDRKMKEIERLDTEEMPKIAEKIAAARDEGDLKENAEYHAQREAQGLLQAKINQLRTQLSKATIINPSDIDRNSISFGATVTVLDLDLDDEEDITLVGSGDEDYDKGYYLISSPLAQGLVGKKVGDEAEIAVPKGTINFKILKIDYSYLDKLMEE